MSFPAAAAAVKAYTESIRALGSALASATSAYPGSLDRALVDALKRRQLTEFLDALKKAQS